MPDARVGHPAMPLLPSDGTTLCTLMPNLPTTSTPVRLVKQSLDDALPVDSTGSVGHHLYGGESKYPPERFDAP